MISENKKRIITIDFTRGTSVILMILVHTMLVYGNTHTREETAFGYIINLLGQGAPMFLITMGVSFVQASKQGLMDTSKRALITLAAGYLMNTLKFIVPIVLFGGLPQSFTDAYGMTPGDPANLVFFFLLGDILQLAGITLFILGLIRHFTTNKYVPFILAVIILLVSRELSGLRTGILGLDYLCDLLWSDTFSVYFPFFPWAAFILLGMFFGLWYLEKQRNERFMFGRMLLFGTAFIIVGVSLCLMDYAYHFGDYYHLGPGGTIVLVGINLVLLGLTYQAIKRADPQSTTIRTLAYCSRHVTALYIIQWVLINWGMYIFGFRNQGTWGVLFIMAVITTGTFTLHALKQRLRTTPKVTTTPT